MAARRRRARRSTVLSDLFFGKIYRVTRANFNSERATPQKYSTFFVQDTWKIGNRLTFNPGLRYEQEKLGGTIITDFELKNNWAPRIGATFDATGDGRTKVYGNYGRFYARIPNDLAARALSADDSFTRGDYFDAGLTRVVPDGTSRRCGWRPAPTLHPGGCGRRHDRSQCEAHVYERADVRRRARGHGEHDVRRAVRLPQHAARPRGRGKLPDGVMSSPQTAVHLRQRRTTS